MIKNLLCLLGTAWLLTACDPQAAATHKAAQAARAASSMAATLAANPFAPQEFEPNGDAMFYSVVPYGYNYTDFDIDSFEVNGAGGGNLEVSIPEAGGGGSACCTELASGLPKGYEFKIKWTRSTYSKRWCEQTVKLTDPVPPGARYLEVHFYQDGHIEVFPSRTASPPPA